MDKSRVPKTLQKWIGHEFSTGCTTGDDYKSFQRSYGIWLRKELDGLEVKMYPNHYDFSAVVTKKGTNGDPDKYAYVSISDVRTWRDRWASEILVRTMSNPKDWTGGPNGYCAIDQLKDRINGLLATF